MQFGFWHSVNEMKNALISIKPEYVEKIISRSKTVEIRNRKINLPSGSRLWIYATLPRGCMAAVAIIRDVIIDSPSKIWNHYHDHIKVPKPVFHSYVNHSPIISAIRLKKVYTIQSNLTLNHIRSEIEGFHPPQFLKYMYQGNPLLDLLYKELRNALSRQDFRNFKGNMDIEIKS